MNHKCPITSCKAIVPASMLMCREHWRLVPAPLQRVVWREYRAAPGRPGHRAACEAAIRSVEKQVAKG